MAGFGRALGKVEQEHHVGGEAEAVAELLKEDAGVDAPQILRLEIGQIDVHEVGNGNRKNHRPLPTPEAVARNGDAAQDAAQKQTDDADRALHEAEFGSGESQTALFYRVYQEALADGSQEGFGETIQEHEDESGKDAGLLEEGQEGTQHRQESRPEGVAGRTGHVGSRTGQGAQMVGGKAEEHQRADAEDNAPGPRRHSIIYLQGSSQHDEWSVAYDGGQTIERTAHTDIEGLLVAVKFKHIEAVGGDVVRGTAESHQPEQGENPRQRGTDGQEESHASKGRANEHLHRPNPQALGAKHINYRAPEGLNHPRQIKPGDKEGGVGVVHAQAFEHDQGYCHHNDIGDSLCNVEGGNPGGGMHSFHKRKV